MKTVCVEHTLTKGHLTLFSEEGVCFKAVVQLDAYSDSFIETIMNDCTFTFITTMNVEWIFVMSEAEWVQMCVILIHNCHQCRIVDINRRLNRQFMIL